MKWGPESSPKCAPKFDIEQTDPSIPLINFDS